MFLRKSALYQNCADLLWEKNALVIEKNFWNWRLKAENLQNFWDQKTTYSNNERSEQFLVTECFFNLFLEVSQIQKIITIMIQIGKNYWDLEIYRKFLLLRFFYSNLPVKNVFSSISKNTGFHLWFKTFRKRIIF